MKQSAISDWLVTAALFAGLLAPIALLSVGLRASPFEERPLTARPAFDLGALFDPGQYKAWSDYLIDLNPSRKSAVVAYARLVRLLANDAATSQVVVGLDGYLFVRGNVTAPCVDERLVSIGAQNMERLASVLRAGGKQFVFAIAPAKEGVYADKLSAPATRLTQCARANSRLYRGVFADNDVGFLDLWPTMQTLRAQGEKDVYGVEDTHWTEIGAAAFVSRLVASLNPESVHDGYRVTGVQQQAPDIARLAGLHVTRDYPVVSFQRPGSHNRSPLTIEHDPPGRPYVRNRSTATEATLSADRLLIIHDSFMYVAWDQVAQFYADALYVHWSALTPERFAEFAAAADSVLLVSVEGELDERLAEHFASPALVEAVAMRLRAETPPRWPGDESPIHQG